MEINNLSEFEEQILASLKEIEKKLTSQITSNNIDIYEHINNLEVKLNNLLQKNESIIETITNQKIYSDKITDFESFKKKTEEILLSQDLKLKNNMGEINYLKTRYETIVKENLLVSGYIGNSCQYKNLSEYLSYNIKELNRNKTDRENVKKEFKDIKIKYDNLMKTMIGLNDSTAERCKDYTNLIRKEIVNFIETKFLEFKENNFNIKAEIYKYNSEHEQHINKKISETKIELGNILNEKINEIKNDNNFMNGRMEINSKNIQDNYINIKKINNDIEEINIKLKDIVTNIKNLNLSLLNNSSQLQGLQGFQSSQGILINQTNTNNKSIHKVMTKNDKNKEVFSENNKKYIENNNNGDHFVNKNNNNNIKLQNLKHVFNTKVSNNKNEKSIQKDLENDCNSENDNYLNIINNNINSSISFEKSKILKGNNKNEDNNNSFHNNQELNKRTLKNKNLSSDLNRCPKKEFIESKSIMPLKDKNQLKSHGILYKYKERNNDMQTQTFLYHPKQGNYNKSQITKEIEYNNIETPKKKLKLNYDIINKINQSKILDLYSFSISPPEGKLDLNLKYMTINGNLQKKFLQVGKTFEIAKDNDSIYKVVDSKIDANNKVQPINSHSCIKNRKQSLKIKYREKNGISTERIKTKSMNHFSPVNHNIIIMPPKFNLPFNKTFIENDNFNEKKINFENFLLRNLGKELKTKENNYCLTGK